MTRVTAAKRRTYEDATPWSAMGVKPLPKPAKEPAASTAHTGAHHAKRADARRLRRLKGNLMSKMCFGCRKPGHLLADCPNAGPANPAVGGTAAGICYKCGASDHTSKRCDRRDASFEFAVCFVCNESGHLASGCPKNERGLYPNGGGCRFCGSVKHLARDCKPTQVGNDGVMVSRVTSSDNPDDDDAIDALRRIDNERRARRSGQTSINSGPFTPGQPASTALENDETGDADEAGRGRSGLPAGGDRRRFEAPAQKQSYGGPAYRSSGQNHGSVGHAAAIASRHEATDARGSMALVQARPSSAASKAIKVVKF